MFAQWDLKRTGTSVTSTRLRLLRAAPAASSSTFCTLSVRSCEQLGQADSAQTLSFAVVFPSSSMIVTVLLSGCSRWNGICQSALARRSESRTEAGVAFISSFADNGLVLLLLLGTSAASSSSFSSVGSRR